MSRRVGEARARRAVSLAVALTALVAAPVAAWALWGSGEHPRLASVAVTLPDPEPRRPGRIDPLIELPGTVVLKGNGPVTKFGASGALQESDVQLLATGGAVRAQAVIADDGPVRTSIWRFTLLDGADPAVLREALDGYATTLGWLARPAPAEITVRQTPSVLRPIDGQRPVLRGHYLRGQDLIRLETSGPTGSLVQTAFDQSLREQLTAFPAER